jgi:outer membrane protein insertion porin family
MDEGFIRVQVSEPEVEVDPDGIMVRVEIEEGPRYKVGLVDVLGDDTLDTAGLLEAIELTPGATFSRTLLSDDVERLRKRYADRGFYAARVRPRTDVDPDALTVDVIFEVEKSNLFFVDWIRVSGNTRTRDGVVRREVSLAEGDLYSDSAINRSRARVRRLGHFEEVSVETQQIDDQSVGITIDVVERPTGAFSFGAGFGSTDGFLLNGSVRQDNLWGRGYSVAVSADLGSISQFGSLRFSDPYFLDSVTAFSASLSYSSREFDSFDQQFLGFGLDLSYPLDEGETRLGTGYGFTSRSVSGISSFQASSMLQREEFQEDTTTSLLSFSARRDKRDDFRFPKKGHVTGGAVEFAGLGGISKYIRFEGRTTWFWPRRLLGMDTTVVVNSRVGYTIPLNDISDFDLLTCSSSPIADCGFIAGSPEVQQLAAIDDDLTLPLTERYFLGGIGPFQVRGFEQRTVGARRSVLGPTSAGSFVFTPSGRDNLGNCLDPSGECNSLTDTEIDDFANLDLTDIIGGNKMFLLNLELQFPISDELGLMGIVFLDTGNAFAENESFDPTELRFGTGFGMQWFSPFGPILVFIGFPLDKLEDESSSVFEFSLGGQQF